MTNPAEAYFERLSLAWERQTGNDSIPTIERIYDQTSSGAYKCVWPGCKFIRHAAFEMWRHVHTAHGTNSLPPEMVARAQARQPR